jgi:hypothetical protein
MIGIKHGEQRAKIPTMKNSIKGTRIPIESKINHDVSACLHASINIPIEKI